MAGVTQQRGGVWAAGPRPATGPGQGRGAHRQHAVTLCRASETGRRPQGGVMMGQGAQVRRESMQQPAAQREHAAIINRESLALTERVCSVNLAQGIDPVVSIT
jgi:hypothetical protein